MEIRNAKISYASLQIEDHNILTFLIGIDGGNFGTALGGYALDRPVDKNIRISSPAGLDCMRKIMEVVEVWKWEDLKDKYIRIEDNGWGSSITKIGNILKDNWFDIDEFMKNYDYDRWVKEAKKDGMLKK